MRPLLIVAALAFIAILVLLGRTFVQSLNQLRTIRRTQFDSISTIRSGERVVIRGRVVSKNDVKAPLSDEPCAWYASKAQQIRSGRHGRSVITIEDLRPDTPFEVRDESGTISIDPNLSLVVTPSTRYYWTANAQLAFMARGLVFGQRAPIDPKQEGTLTRADETTFLEIIGFHLRYDEHVITHADEVICAGVAMHGPRGMTITSEKRGQGVIATPEDSPARKNLQNQVFVNGAVFVVFLILVLGLPLLLR